MWSQVATIAWAQLRISRNHFPRHGWGTFLVWVVSALWYSVFVALAVLLAIAFPHQSLAELRPVLSAVFLGVFAFWQIVPLLTLSSGWSLQLNKIQIYPVSNNTLFSIEVFLRLSTAPEMLILLSGIFVGLLRHPAIGVVWPLLLLLFIPFNLFLSLGIRELFLRSFARNRFRELLAILVVTISILPQLLIRTMAGQKSARYFWKVATSVATPWQEVAKLSTGAFSFPDLALLLIWTAACYWLGRRQFERSLVEDDAFRSASSPAAGLDVRESVGGAARKSFISGLLSDPLGVLVEKELRSLLRMPRFRILLGMATVFSVFIFVPIAFGQSGRSGPSFMRENFLPIATLYGLLLMSDALLLNMFGFDRAGAQIYFVAPVKFGMVIRAKNIVAAGFVAIQCAGVILLSLAFRVAGSPLNVLSSVGSACVVGTFFLSVGNLMSVHMARPVDPNQTFRKQAGGKMQLWLVLCSVGMFVLVGFAFLARWAFRNDWALPGILAIEFLIGLVLYRVATDSAVEHGNREREKLLDALSKGASAIGS